MPSWIYYLCIFFIGVGGNFLMAYFCNTENHCLPTDASFVFGILIGLASAVGNIHGKFED